MGITTLAAVWRTNLRRLRERPAPSFLLAWNAYVFALVLTTDADMFVISVGVANLVGEYQVEWNELMAAALLGALPVLVIFSILNRHLVEAITAGALKG